MNQTEENQPEDSKNNDLNMDSGNNNTTPDADTSDEPVSYTHLDVYKRQPTNSSNTAVYDSK